MLPPRLAALLGIADPNEITEATLRALTETRVAEDQDLDFKKSRYDFGPKGRFELAKDVAALTNQVGGLLIIGIEEDEQGRAAVLAPVELDDEFKGFIRQVVADRIHPLIDGVSVVAVSTDADPTVGYYLVVVPRSAMAPHGVRHQNPDPLYLCWPLRHGTTTHYMRETELAARYRDRFMLARDQVDRLNKIHADGRRNERVDHVATAIALVPAIPGHRPLTAAKGALVEDYLATRRPIYPESEVRSLVGSRRQVARRRLRLEDGSIAAELYTDGSGWIRRISGNGPSGYVHLDVRWFESEVVDMVDFLSGYAAWTGAAGDCVVSACMYGASDGRRVGWRSAGSDTVWIDHGLPTEPAETTISLIPASSLDVAIANAYPLVRDLVQDMGLAAPLTLRSGIPGSPS